jgi:hypothetical protein
MAYFPHAFSYLVKLEKKKSNLHSRTKSIGPLDYPQPKLTHVSGELILCLRPNPNIPKRTLIHHDKEHGFGFAQLNFAKLPAMGWREYDTSSLPMDANLEQLT